MAISLKEAAKRGQQPQERIGREVYSHLYRTGVKRPISVASIYIDPDGTASYKGKIVRTSDGKFLPFATAQLTAQGERTFKEAGKSVPKSISDFIEGKGSSVSSRAQLAERDRERQKHEAERKAQKARERAEAERKKREARERAEAAQRAREAAARAERERAAAAKPPPPATGSPSTTAKVAAPKPTVQPDTSKNMGLLGGIGRFLGGAAEVATGFIPGTWDDKLLDAGKNLLGAGTRDRGARGTVQDRGARGTVQAPGNLPVPFQQPGFPSMPPTGGGGGQGVFRPSPMDFGPFEFDPWALYKGLGSGSMPQTNLPMQGGNMGQMLMMMLLKKSMSRKSGNQRAILEAMLSGSLNGGPFQEPTPVQTPRGVEYHSPYGFRTVDVMGQKVAVFKPIAQALGLLPKTSRCKISAADMKALRKADRLTKRVKKLAQDTGRLKVTNR